MQSPLGIRRVWHGGGCTWDAGYTVEPSGDVVGFNQRNVNEAGCPPDDPSDIPYPPLLLHSTPTATIKSFQLKGLKHLVLLALLIFWKKIQ